MLKKMLKSKRFNKAVKAVEISEAAIDGYSTPLAFQDFLKNISNIPGNIYIVNGLILLAPLTGLLGAYDAHLEHQGSNKLNIPRKIYRVVTDWSFFWLFARITADECYGEFRCKLIEIQEDQCITSDNIYYNYALAAGLLAIPLGVPVNQIPEKFKEVLPVKIYSGSVLALLTAMVVATLPQDIIPFDERTVSDQLIIICASIVIGSIIEALKAKGILKKAFERISTAINIVGVSLWYTQAALENAESSSSSSSSTSSSPSSSSSYYVMIAALTMSVGLLLLTFIKAYRHNYPEAEEMKPLIDEEKPQNSPYDTTFSIQVDDEEAAIQQTQAELSSSLGIFQPADLKKIDHLTLDPAVKPRDFAKVARRLSY